MGSTKSAHALSGIVLFIAIALVLLIPLGYQARTRPVERPEPAGTNPIEVGLRPSGVAVDPQIDLAVVANRDSNTVSVIDISTGDSAPIGVGQQPEGVAIKPTQGPNDPNLAIVANRISRRFSSLSGAGS